ncbi:Retrotransposon gag protein [Rhizoctonia solani]|uniref:Retrotransposon gag protein n=1 Tax=Rhizoctonia solani TaxID=456999 RepID=A0A8H7M2Q5_9AGAM|nr:Retrotransposon gag protein [Rhizoctonia solani]
MRWQPAPGAPLVPRPLSIKESYGEISLGRAISLILGLQNQVLQLKRELKETKEATKEAQDWMGAVNQALTCIEARGGAPTHQKTGNLRQSRPRPGPYPKPTLSSALVRPSLPGPSPPKLPPLCTTNSRPGSPASPYSPPPLPICLRSPQVPQPAAPVAAYQTPVKVDHPDAYTGKIGNKARQWLTRMLAWVRLNQRMFPTNQEVLSFLLMNMKDMAGAWAHPHLDQLGSHRALIQLVDDFRTEFLAAFGNPDATQAAERQITHLTQTGTCAEYITKFRTIAMDLDWNTPPSVGNLHEASTGRSAASLPLKNGAQPPSWSCRTRPWSLTTPSARSVPATRLRVVSPGTPSTPNRGASTSQQATRPGHLSSNPNFVSKEEQTAAGLKASASNAEESVKKEAAKIGKESGPKLGKD